MNQGFNFRFGEMQENDPTGSQSGTPIENVSYPTASNTRNLCFVLLNGDLMFLNYSYLISGEYSKENSSIILTFTTHQIELNGSSLDAMYQLLMDHVPRIIVEAEERYALLGTDQEYSIKKIVVTKL